jgi:hypothetical protein
LKPPAGTQASKWTVPVSINVTANFSSRHAPELVHRVGRPWRTGHACRVFRREVVPDWPSRPQYARWACQPGPGTAIRPGPASSGRGVPESNATTAMRWGGS